MNLHISIIMPAYNQAAFIRRAILSLYAQTHPEWELIIVNDGSTDDTEAFIRDFLSDDRVTYIKNEENQGLGRALNQGLDAACHDLVAYLPADDCYFENHLETLCRMVCPFVYPCTIKKQRFASAKKNLFLPSNCNIFINFALYATYHKHVFIT